MARQAETDIILIIWDTSGSPNAKIQVYIYTLIQQTG